MIELPDEILSFIFILASDEDLLFNHGLPTTMSTSAWFKNAIGNWTLRQPSEALNVLQRRSYSTKRNIKDTCRTFHRIAEELMFNCLFFNGPEKLSYLCAELDKTQVDPPRGWWTKRIHVTCYNAKSFLDVEAATSLSTILRHCRNTEIVMLAIPSTVESLTLVADTLYNFNRNLRTLHLSLPTTALDKLIWLLSGLPNLGFAHFSFTSPTDLSPDEEDCPELGCAEEIEIALPRLTQLSLYGHTGPFIEQACQWKLPALRFLSLNTVHSDIIPFLDVYGRGLVYLDVTCTTSVRMDAVFSRCPNLETICFNADWTQEEELRHDNIRNVGLHGLGLAFTPPSGGRPPIFPLDSMIRRANDSNFKSLMAEGHFPKIERVRMLSTAVLMELERNGGPCKPQPRGEYEYVDELEDGLKRWETWWDICEKANVRLEDCTGGPLGVLPLEESDLEEETNEEDEAEASEESDEEWEEYSWEYEVPPIDEGGSTTSGVEELRKLIEECRQMEADRDVF
ncbi:hypothetical protein CYLTODRAFT_485000 [Cylindrobasidium torrendii FP15055 ss-10]|uniref:Uncharacterized protein n=1 Tax=Cylindrobasidium torrendii FP15055 ss-10 TaxID=1314674 RepID=A0A0D7BTJ9_9AGAR|nr:hypothetical protein CYLTODRAFT_485000 [Cylindrobasidium torrendii FP15055 ss-10]